MIGAVLAGGENRRIPVPKGLLIVNGATVIESSIKILGRVFGKVIISANEPEIYFFAGAKMVGDTVKGKGPVSGIVSVLGSIPEDAVFVVACDMPFIKERLIRFMADRYRETTRAVGSQQSARQDSECGIRAQKSQNENIDAVIPVFEGKKQPLFGIYANTERLIKTMEAAIESGQTGLARMLAALNVLYLEEDEVRAIDPLGESFININTREDYAKIGGTLCLA